MKRSRWAAAAVLWLVHSLSSAAEVVGVGNFSHIVADLDRSIVFYRDVLGLEPNLAPTAFTGDPAIMRMGATPGAQSRIATFRIPGSELGVELIEYRDIDRRPVQVRFQDPGAANLQLRVRSLDPILARLPQSEGRIWTPSGEPVTLRETLRIIFLQDPDGFFVELIENAAPPEDAPAGNVIGADFELMIADSEQTARFYREGLGFKPQIGDAFDDTKLLTDTVNTQGAAFRRTTSTIPGTSVSMPFLEFANITRKPLHTRTQDPGTAILQLRVSDVEVMTAQLAAAGGTVISEGDAPVDIGGGRLIAIVRDPNNLFLELLPSGPATLTQQRQDSAPQLTSQQQRARRQQSTPPSELQPVATPRAPAAPARAPEQQVAGVAVETSPATEAEPGDRRSLEVLVVAVRQAGRTSFTTEDGSVWVQTSGTRTHFPDVPFGAEIRPGALGSYFLVPTTGGSAVRVRRND